MNRTSKGAAAAIAAVLSLLTLGTPAFAAESGSGEHCTINAQNDEYACFGSFSEAMAHASGDARLAGDVVQGTFFEHENFDGASLTIVGELCEKDGWVNWQYDLADEWKDRITSVQAWGRCWLWLYPEPNLGGDRDGPFKENHAYIGDYMNDRTESIGFS